MPLSLPDWIPWWAVLLVLLPGLLYLLAFLAMPFSVLGLKSRLDGLDARLDEIQGEVRALALRLPERGDDPAMRPRPPIPPAPARGASRLAPEPPAAPDPSTPARRPPRTEPRIDWPR
ncbi:MAG TPA: hypothetical protein VGC80_04855 [Acetobacteraceae bacterium]